MLDDKQIIDNAFLGFVSGYTLLVILIEVLGFYSLDIDKPVPDRVTYS